MVLGALPFLTLGGIFSAASARLRGRTTGFGLLVSALCLPVCDCTMASCGRELSRVPLPLAAWIVTLGSCCNAPALAATWIVLGPRVLVARVLSCIVAAAATALLWRVAGRATLSEPAGGSMEQIPLAMRFVQATSRGLCLFALAAAPACLLIASGWANIVSQSPVAAVVLASILSPCSSSDALLAHALFAQPKCQLAFVVAAQCVDLRQILMLRRTFGVRRAVAALASSTTAIALGYVVLS